MFAGQGPDVLSGSLTTFYRADIRGAIFLQLPLPES